LLAVSAIRLSSHALRAILGQQVSVAGASTLAGPPLAAQIGSWLETSNSAFEASTPVQVIERGESDRIWRIAPRCAALNSALAGNAR